MDVYLDPKCCICGKPAKYIIEWYGVNQFGKNPEVADEKSVCSNFNHIVQASRHEDYGGVPDGIVDYKTLNIEHPSLLEKVIEAMDNN